MVPLLAPAFIPARPDALSSARAASHLTVYGAAAPLAAMGRELYKI
jgi:hypothetical protein